jgi:hypothetical protein
MYDALNPQFSSPTHEQWLDTARAMVDNAEEAGHILSFDDAYRATSRFDRAYLDYPLIAATGEESVADMDASTFFRTTEALDTVMQFANPRLRMMAASFAIELCGVIPQSTQPHEKAEPTARNTASHRNGNPRHQPFAPIEYCWVANP